MALESSVALEAKLPSNLRSVYLKIKRETNIIARWLIENNCVGSGETAKPPGERVFVVNNLTSFAESIVARGVTVPGRILEALVYSINARNEVSNWYKTFVKEGNQKQRKSNRNHAHFILVLRRILDKFQEHKSASTVEPGSHQGDTQLLAPSATITTGKFHVLLGLNVDESEDLTPSTDSALSGQESAAGLEVEASEEDSYVVQDDGMAGKLELVLAILELDTALADIKAYWTEVAKGSISFLLATYLTNIHVSLAKEEFSQSLTKLQITSNEGLIKAYQLAQDPSALVKADAMFATGFGFQKPPQALRLALALGGSNFEQLDELAKIGIIHDKGDAHMTDLIDLISDLRKALAQGGDQPGTDSFLKWLEDNYGQKDITKFLLDDPSLKATNFTTSNELVVHLEILRVISLSYSAGLQQWRKSSMLRGPATLFAFCKQVHSSIQPTSALFEFSDAEHEVKRKNAIFEEMVLGLSRCKVSLINSYLDHPWIVGWDVLNFSESAASRGCATAICRHSLTIVLHSYNAARQLGFLKEITVLERLCNDLQMAVFREERPTRKFGSCFYRLIGGQIDFKNDPDNLFATMRELKASCGRPQAATLPNSHTYDLKMPKKTWRVRPNLNDISLAYACGSNVKPGTLSDNAWSLIDKKLGIQSTKRPKKAEGTSVRMSKLRRVIEPEFAGDFPIAGINFFALTSACESLLRKVGERALHIGISDPTLRDKGWYILNMFLCGADDPYPELVEIFGQCMLEPMSDEFTDKALGDFIWPIFTARTQSHTPESRVEAEHEEALATLRRAVGGFMIVRADGSVRIG